MPHRKHKRHALSSVNVETVRAIRKNFSPLERDPKIVNRVEPRYVPPKLTEAALSGVELIEPIEADEQPEPAQEPEQ